MSVASASAGEADSAAWDDGDAHKAVPGPSERFVPDKTRWKRFALFEWTSIEPVEESEQRQTSYWSVALLWFSANVNCSCGIARPC